MHILLILGFLVATSACAQFELVEGVEIVAKKERKSEPIVSEWAARRSASFTQELIEAITSCNRNLVHQLLHEMEREQVPLDKMLAPLGLETLLMHALITPGDSVDIVRDLITSGANVNTHNLATAEVSAHGDTPLMIAAGLGRNDHVELLLAYGARVNDIDECGGTALMHAAAGPDYHARFLSGADHKTITKKRHARNSPTSSMSEDEERGAIARLLIRSGANIHAKTQNSTCTHFDDTALHVALITNNEIVAFELIKAGALEQDTCPELVYFAIKQGASTDKDGAMRHESKRVHLVELLLAAGIDPNYTSKEGETPLMCASHSGEIKLVDLLLKYGANPTTVDQNSQTARDKAEKAGWKDIAKHLAVAEEEYVRAKRWSTLTSYYSIVGVIGVGLCCCLAYIQRSFKDKIQ